MSTTGSARLHIGVGIDTARYGHQVSFLSEDRQAAASPLSDPRLSNLLAVSLILLWSVA